jgi:hypothetical protein
VDLGFLKKHVLVPVRQARVDAAEDVGWVDNLTKDQFEDVPEYTGDARVVTAEYERSLSEAYLRARHTDREIDREVVGDTAATGSGAQRLVRLGDLKEFRVAKGDTDPRGWTVVASDGHKIGEVSELLVDTRSLEARYIDCDVDEDKLGLEGVDRHVLVPIDAARLDRHKKNVVLDGVFAKDVGAIPVYGGLPLEERAEREVREAFRLDERGDPRDSRYAADARDIDARRDADMFYGARRDARRMAATDRAADADDRPGHIGDRAATGDRISDREVRVSGRDEAVLREGDEATLRDEDREIRIRLSGDDIVIEKRPRS